MEHRYGTIERGKILSASNGEYTIASLDRDGITTPPLKPVNTSATFSAGDMVYFFYFKDGTGRILCECP